MYYLVILNGICAIPIDLPSRMPTMVIWLFDNSVSVSVSVSFEEGTMYHYAESVSLGGRQFVHVALLWSARRASSASAPWDHNWAMRRAGRWIPFENRKRIDPGDVANGAYIRWRTKPGAPHDYYLRNEGRYQARQLLVHKCNDPLRWESLRRAKRRNVGARYAWRRALQGVPNRAILLRLARMVSHDPTLSVGAIARRFDVHPGNVSRWLAQLQALRLRFEARQAHPVPYATPSIELVDAPAILPARPLCCPSPTEKRSEADPPRLTYRTWLRLFAR